MNISRKKIFYYLVSIILLIFLNFFGGLKPLKSFFNSILNPILSATQRLEGSFETTIGFWGRTKKIAQENKELTTLLKEYSFDQVAFEQLKQENLELKKLLNYEKENATDRSGIIAAIVGRDPIDSQDVFIIDRGINDGIKNYSAVTHENMLIAEIIKNDEQISFARSIFSDQSKISAKVVSSKNKVDGEVVGEKGLALRMKLIPPEVELKKNDLIITAGLEDNLPAGIVIGRVETVEKPVNTFFQEAIILPLQSFDQINFVKVISQ